MKIISVILFLLISISVFPQTTTYSKEEERMINYASNQRAKIYMEEPDQNPRAFFDSCGSFFKKYPNSFAKPNVFNFMLEAAFYSSLDTSKIFPLIDSVLFYDNLPGTKESIGGNLIDRNVDVKKGRSFIVSILPILTNNYHRFHSYILLARADIKLGDFPSAKINFENALKADSSRSEGWYEYLGYLTMMNCNEEAAVQLQKILEMEKSDSFYKPRCTYNSRIIEKDMSNVTFRNYNGKATKIRSLKGNVCVLKIFNYWKGEYKREFEAMKNLEKEYPGVKFVYIVYGDAAKELTDKFLDNPEFSFLKKHILLKGGTEFGKQYSFNGFSRAIIIDKKGKVKYDYDYRKDIETTLYFNLQKLLNEKPGKKI